MGLTGNGVMATGRYSKRNPVTTVTAPGPSART